MPFFKNSDGLQQNPTDLTPPQICLQSWLNFYSWVLSGEGPEPPDEETLNNDQYLDDYVNDWQDKMKKRAKGQGKNTKRFEIE